jgi:AAA ATPase domain
MPRFNPFRPGSIVTPGMFSGRVVELQGMERALYQTKNGNPHNFLLHGERGIGKSSLLYYLQWVAKGDIDPLEGAKYNFLTVSIELEPSTTYTDIIQKIGSELRREVAKRRPAIEFGKSAWDFLKRWEVMGVKYTDSQEQPKPSELIDELSSTAEQTLTKFGDEIDGILILVDEADKAPAAANLGEFAKIFTERLTKRGSYRVCLGLAGLSTLLPTLRQSHESSPRIFEIFTLEPLSRPERIQVIRSGLSEAKDKNGFETSIASDAMETISTLSEGYPHFLQQFAFSAFNEDTDDVIDSVDVANGAFHPDNGAIQQLGLKYFHELYFDQIGADEYRDVLRAMAEHFDNWVTKAQIRKTVTIRDSTLNNAITALKKRHIILAKPGVSGTYRLPTRSFAVWIRAFTKARQEVASPPSPANPTPKA